jgi:hypothetical protein
MGEKIYGGLSNATKSIARSFVILDAALREGLPFDRTSKRVIWEDKLQKNFTKPRGSS